MARKANINSKRGRASQKTRQKILRTPKITVTDNGVVRLQTPANTGKRTK